MMQPGWKVFFQGAMFGLMVLPFTVAVGKRDWFYAIFFFNVMFAAFYFGGKNAEDLGHIGKGPFFYANLLRQFSKTISSGSRMHPKVALEMGAYIITKGRMLTNPERTKAIINTDFNNDPPEAA